jgi:hypothetical protein
MARGFGATLGVGATDKVVSALATMSAQRSYAIRVLKNGDGAASNGHIFRQDNAIASLTDLFDYQTNTFRYASPWTTTEVGLWTIVPPSSAVWHSIVVTYDGGSAANDPVIYVDGASVTVTETVAPVGTRIVGGLVFTLGNAASNNRNWDGSLAEFAVWDRLLTATEANRLGIGYSPAFFPTGRVEYIPMREANVGQAGTPTITGTLFQPHPPNVIDTIPTHQAGARAAILAH